MPKVTLTQLFVEQSADCPPDKARIDFYDKKVVGLSLKVLASGHKAFYIRFRDERGKLIERKMGSAASMKLAEARKAASEVLAQVAVGDDPFEKHRTLKQVPTLAEFVETAYMPHIKGYKRSWSTDETLLRNHILPKLGKLYLDEIKRQHLIEVFSEHRLTHKPASTNRVIILTRYIFNCALKWEVEGMTRNPTAGINLYPENNKRERYLNDDEALRLFEALEASPNPLLPFIIAMLLLTGARKREVLDAKWQDIDLEKRLWRIEFNKTGQTRHAPVSEGLLSLLEKLPRLAGNDYLFPNPKTGKPFVSIFHSWDTARRNAGLKDVRIHDLRHSFASYLINQGHSLYEVQNLLGHTQVKTTQRYAHLSNKSLLNAADSAAASVPWDREAREGNKVQTTEKEVTAEEVPAKARTKALPEPPSSTTRRVLRPAASSTTKKEAPGKTVSPPRSGEPPDREPST